MKKTRDLRAEILGPAVELMAQTGRGATLPVVGASMQPTLTEGQRIAVELGHASRHRGDVLVFRGADTLVVHRLLGPARFPDGEPAWRTRGDGKIELDPPIDDERVLGLALAVEDEDGWWDLRNRGGRLYGLALAWHDLAWAAAGVLARWTDRQFRRAGLPAPWKHWVATTDAALLSLAHALLFRLMHARLSRSPLEDGSSPGPGESSP